MRAGLSRRFAVPPPAVYNEPDLLVAASDVEPARPAVLLARRGVGVSDAPPFLVEREQPPALVALDMLDDRGRRDRALHPPGKVLDRQLPAERAARQARNVARALPGAVGAGVGRTLRIAHDVGERLPDRRQQPDFVALGRVLPAHPAGESASFMV